MRGEGKVAVVSGGSSGIGYHTALALKRAGCVVYTLSRHPAAMEGVTQLTADVTQEAQLRSAVARILAERGRIDLLVCCAGFGISGAAEFTRPEDAHAQLETNLFGTDNLIRAVLPQMRTQKSGRIVCVSSVAGALPIPFQLWYSAGKAAVNAYTLALANEVRPFGITVCAVLPGDVATGFTGSRKKSTAGDDVYGGRIARSVAGMEKDERNGIPAERAGGFVARCALKKRSRPLMTFGAQYRLFLLLAKLLPRGLSNRIVGLLYAR